MNHYDPLESNYDPYFAVGFRVVVLVFLIAVSYTVGTYALLPLVAWDAVSALKHMGIQL